MSATKPDFDSLGRETLWPAAEWQSAWDRLAAEEHREELWRTLVALSAGGTRPSASAAALVQALHAGSDDDAEPGR